jgi:hemoglobin
MEDEAMTTLYEFAGGDEALHRLEELFYTKVLGLGFQYIIDVHRHLKITDEQRERFVALYLEAIDEAGLPDDDAFRAAVREHLEFGARVAQQNSHAETDDQLHPIREVPAWTWPRQSEN